MDDLGQQLAAAFAAEHAEHVAAIRQALIAAEVGATPDLREIFRRAHSLKGAARAVDEATVEELAHTLESLLAAIEAGRRPLDADTIEEARGLIDAIEDARQPDIWSSTASDDADEPKPASGAPADLVRVSARHLEDLAVALRALQGDLESRMLIASDLGGTRAEIDAIRRDCAAPGASLATIAARLERLRSVSEGIATRRIVADAQVARAAAALEREAERILLVPAASIADGLDRAVRGIADDQGKQVLFEIDDDGAEADRRVLQGLRDPINHLLRNAVSHGIAMPADRLAASKPAQGRVRLEIRAERGQLGIAIEDDGNGPDMARIEAAARRGGLIGGDRSIPPEPALLALLFQHGFSTAPDVDRVSGRGVGLAAAADAVRRLHGSIRLERGASGGLRAVIAVPLAVTRQTALLVEVDGQAFGIPARAVRRLLRVDPARLGRAEGVPVIRLEDDRSPVPVVALAALLGLPVGPTDAVPGAALLIEREAARFVLTVDRLLDVRQLSFGDPAAIAADVPLVFGTAMAAEGRVALVLSPEALLDRLARDHQALAAAGPAFVAVEAPVRTVLIVDDSITTRTLERGILEQAGYRVLLSVDGLDGLERLRSGADPIDLVVADVEMPRLDGFGLLTAIRNDPGLADIPVIMMTSRNSPDDIQRGLDLGADAYVAKQEFEQGLLVAAIRRLI